jgi:formylglycine-generating enzyme required for sulfatase activity
MDRLRHTLPLLLAVAFGCGGGAGGAGHDGGPADGPGDGPAAEAATPDGAEPDAEPDAAPDAAADGPRGDAAGEDGAGGCAAEMVPVAGACMDRYEAPNVAGALPLVMYTFVEAEAWCAARTKRLCFDDEWQTACEGPDLWAYPYGNTRVVGECNDDKVWRTYNQTLLNGWPPSASSPGVGSLADLFAAARAVGTTAAQAADHVESLYQGEGGGANAACVGAAGAYDLVGNVEEWTRRRDGGEPQFHGKLKGRYWAESRTCQNGVTTHGDAFRFYEIGFRCCRDL